jgi:hypothetical protein
MRFPNSAIPPEKSGWQNPNAKGGWLRIRQESAAVE